MKTKPQHNRKLVKYSVKCVEVANELHINIRYYLILKDKVYHWGDILDYKQHKVRKHQIILIKYNKMNKLIGS